MFSALTGCSALALPFPLASVFTRLSAAASPSPSSSAAAAADRFGGMIGLLKRLRFNEITVLGSDNHNPKNKSVKLTKKKTGTQQQHRGDTNTKMALYNNASNTVMFQGFHGKHRSPKRLLKAFDSFYTFCLTIFVYIVLVG